MREARVERGVGKGRGEERTPARRRRPEAFSRQPRGRVSSRGSRPRREKKRHTGERETDGATRRARPDSRARGFPRAHRAYRRSRARVSSVGAASPRSILGRGDGLHPASETHLAGPHARRISAHLVEGADVLRPGVRLEVLQDHLLDDQALLRPGVARCGRHGGAVAVFSARAAKEASARSGEWRAKTRRDLGEKRGTSSDGGKNGYNWSSSREIAALRQEFGVEIGRLSVTFQSTDSLFFKDRFPPIDDVYFAPPSWP